MKSHLVHCPNCDCSFLLDEPLRLNSNNAMKTECVHCAKTFVCRYSSGRIFTLALQPNNTVCDILSITYIDSLKYIEIAPIYNEVFPSGITPFIRSFSLRFDFDLALMPENSAILNS